MSTWADILGAKDGAEFADEFPPGYEPPWPWLPGCARYADPAVLDRRAVVDFFAAGDPQHPAAIADLLARHSGSRSPGLLDARNAYISHLEGHGEPGTDWATVAPETVERLGGLTVCQELEQVTQANRRASKAAAYLAARGIDLHALIRTHRSGTIDAETLADRITYALHAGLSPDELHAAIADPTEPPNDALATLAGLRR